MARPSKYNEEVIKQAYQLSLLGLTDKQMAKVFSVTERTFNNWKKSHDEFFQSIKKGKDIADGQVAASLYERACGYNHPEDKVFCTNVEGVPTVTTVETIKHYPPDTAAAFIWLKNRQPNHWKPDHQLAPDGETPAPTRIEIIEVDGRKTN